MIKYHVKTGDGMGYYGVGYESYRQAESLLKISQEHDPQAFIVEEEYHFTNADRIRAMSDEELAKLLSHDARACPDRITRCHDYGFNCERCWIEWLKQPVKENDNG